MTTPAAVHKKLINCLTNHNVAHCLQLHDALHNVPTLLLTHTSLTLHSHPTHTPLTPHSHYTHTTLTLSLHSHSTHTTLTPYSHYTHTSLTPHSHCHYTHAWVRSCYRYSNCPVTPCPNTAICTAAEELAAPASAADVGAATETADC